MRDDEAAAIQVVEAVMVAVLLLSGILFVTITAPPPIPRDDPGLDTQKLAKDSLDILIAAEIDDPNSPGNTITFDEWVLQILDGTGNVADAVDDYLDAILPLGFRGLVRFNTGLDTIVLVPDTGGTDPHVRTAAVASTLVVIDSSAIAETALTNYAAGESITPGLWLCLISPFGSVDGPQSQDWLDLWNAEPDGPNRIPGWMPHGVWRTYTDLGCSLGQADFEVSDDGLDAESLVAYNIDLVVWPGV